MPQIVAKSFKVQLTGQRDFIRAKSTLMTKILILHGPNLNLLGMRESMHYGSKSIEDINQELEQLGTKLGHDLLFFQSNAEYQLIERIHYAAEEQVKFIIFNPAGFTHTSIALRDAILATQIPFIEVHLSNIYKREPFRHHSFFSDIATGVIIGLGYHGYLLALEAVNYYLSQRS
jgi:3-dehydroquinate dehydratase II